MAGIAGRLALQYPESNGGWTVRLRTFYDWLIPQEDRHALIVLLGAVAFLLLIACANVANLMLARATVRRREMAIRTALGAGRGRLVRQLLTESLLLSLLGCVLGLVFAHLGLRLAGVTSVDFVPRGDEISLDGNVLLFTLCISLLTGLLFGLVPALQTAHADMNATLKEGSRSAGFSARNRTRNILVVAETALALVLLIGIGLLLRSLGELLQVDPGYATRNLLTGQISLPEGKYPSDKEYVSFHRRLMERLQALPGVESASLASGLPLAGGGTAMEVHIEDRPPDPDGRQPSAQWRLVAPGYFRTMGIPLLAGRDTNDRDLREGDGGFVGVVISEEMARRYWPDQNPIGRRFHPWALSRPAVTIVGVVGNVRLFGLETQPEPAVYLNFAAGAWNPMFVVLRTALDPEGYAAALRNEVRALDPNLPVAAIRTMDEIRDSSLTSRRFIVILLGIFAVVALVLAAVGLFAVMAYLVAQRTHEIGLRLALGARSRDILRLIVGRGMMLTFAGIACGVAGGFALTRVMSSMLFGAVGARDPLTFSTTAALLAFVAFLACWIPARAAARVDPLRAIHHE
jgi:putative ABC transport system permease protein